MKKEKEGEKRVIDVLAKVTRNGLGLSEKEHGIKEEGKIDSQAA